jgi:NAD(P) transhydrogenase subunit beta
VSRDEPGFAGVDNDLYYSENTMMVFGDTKAVLGDVVKALAGGRTA